MVENFVEVSPEQMRQIANIIEGAKATIYSTIVKYETETALLGNVWSDDRFGSEFAKIYIPTHDGIIETGYTIVDGMTQIQNNMYSNADAWEKTDEANAS
jgi:uncharacterized protein YukE